MGLIGFLDDYIKVFRKHKEGLKGRFKVIGQVGLGLIVGVTLYVSDDVLIREKVSISEVGVVTSTVDEGFVSENSQTVLTKDIKSTKTTIPFSRITSLITLGSGRFSGTMPRRSVGSCLLLSRS